MTFFDLDAVTPHSRRLTGPRRFGTVHPGRVRQVIAPDIAPAATQVLILFPCARSAGQLVAGVPAAARAVREAAVAGYSNIAVVTPQQWWPDPWIRREVARLGGGAAVSFQTEARALASATFDPAIIDGAKLPPAEAYAAASGGAPAQRSTPVDAARLLHQHSRALVRATAKPNDGIVSRHLNRPVSQAISSPLLRLREVTPLHASLGTVGLAMLMFAALASGSELGLILGALLFQAASVCDGVDGEIARATFRTSAAGARLDSLIDAATNLAFIAGTSFNLYLRGDSESALLGAAGLVVFALGLAIIARRSRNQSAGLTFDAVKEQVGQHPSALMTFLTWLTMRDFFALAFAVLIVAGFAGFALHAFAVIVMGWFMVVVLVMRGKS